LLKDQQEKDESEGLEEQSDEEILPIRFYK
jgi:hypothetical protein